MAVTLAQLRTQIADTAKFFPPSSDTPEVLGLGDGTKVLYTLSQDNPIASSIVVYNWTVPTSGLFVPTAYASSAWTLANTNQIQFTTAPANTLTIGANYQATYFSDAQLQDFITRNTTKYGGISDQVVLKACAYDIIDLYIMDIERFRKYRYGDAEYDPAAVLQALVKNKENLLKDLQGVTDVQQRAVPSLTIGGVGYQPYQPIR